VSFLVQGYGPVSIVFSSLSVGFSYWFAFSYWRDVRRSGWPPVVRSAIGFALFYLVLSSLGPYLLAYSMAHGVRNRAFYYNAIYLYLHFQYNGWFTFGVLALLLWWVFRGSGRNRRNERLARVFVWLLGLACVPAYCLSLLWTAPPVWVWVAAGTGAGLQVAAGVVFFVLLVRRRHEWRTSLLPAVRKLWGLALAAFAIKLVLQMLSVVPSLGMLAFGHRSVIIAYLHLVVLGFVTLALLGFFEAVRLSDVWQRPAHMELVVFASGVVFNEVLLLAQSLLQISRVVWASAGYWLFGAALLLCSGALLLATRR
jgi:hypothetical protein